MSRRTWLGLLVLLSVVSQAQAGLQLPGPTWTFEGAGKARFGTDVASDGQTALVAAPGARAVYVFERGAEGAWTLTQTIEDPAFVHARAVAVDGAVAAIGVASGRSYVQCQPDPNPERPPICTITCTKSGHVLLLDRTTGGWVVRQQLGPVDYSHSFGWSLDLEGATLLVGNPAWEGGGCSDGQARGAVHVFEREAGGAWAEVARFEGAHPHERFGSAVAVSGRRAVAGVPGYDGRVADMGAVAVLARNDVEWSLAQIVGVTQASPGSRWGDAVAIEGDLFVVGAPGASPTAGVVGLAGAGEAAVFSNGPAGFRFVTGLTPPLRRAGDGFGTDVAIANGVVLVGAPGRDVDGGCGGCGGVDEFTPAAGAAWTWSGGMAPRDLPFAGSMGSALAATSDDVLVGAPGHGGGRGAVYARAS